MTTIGQRTWSIRAWRLHCTSSKEATIAKRGRNEGSVYRRRDGRWAAAVSTAAGKRKTLYASTRGAVAEKLRQAQHQRALGLPFAGERLTLAQHLATWLEESARPTLRLRTYDLYRMIVEGHLTPAFGRTRLVKLTPGAIQAYMNRKPADGLSPHTVRNHHAVLRRALAQAERWDLVPRNVARLVTPRRAPREEVRPLTPEQGRTFLHAVRDDRFEALYHVALALGLRQGEALGLTWDDVDLDAGTLTVRHSLQRHDREYRLVEPKTLRSRRTGGLPAQIVQTLRRHRTRQREDRLRAGPVGGVSGGTSCFAVRTAIRCPVPWSRTVSRPRFAPQGCRASASTTCATPRRPLCWPRASRSRW